MWTVYRCFDKDGVLLYVGCASDCKSRLWNHKCKLASWYPRMIRFTVTDYPSRNLARIAEGLAILSEKPLFNKRNSEWVGIPECASRAESIERQMLERDRNLQSMLEHSPKVRRAIQYKYG